MTDAWAVVAANRPHLLAYAYAHGGGEDAVQTACLRLAQALARGATFGAPGAVIVYVTAAIRCAIIDEARSWHARHAVPLAAAPALGADDAAIGEAVVADWLRPLPERQRVALWRRYVYGEPPREIAAARPDLYPTADAARRSLFAGRRALREGR